jgi:hypothetical protein
LWGIAVSGVVREGDETLTLVEDADVGVAMAEVVRRWWVTLLERLLNGTPWPLPIGVVPAVDGDVGENVDEGEDDDGSWSWERCSVLSWDDRSWWWWDVDVVVEVVGGDFKLALYDVTDLRVGTWLAGPPGPPPMGDARPPRAVGGVILVLTVRLLRGRPVPESFFADVNPNVLSGSIEISTFFSCTEFFLAGVVCCGMDDEMLFDGPRNRDEDEGDVSKEFE